MWWNQSSINVEFSLKNGIIVVAFVCVCFHQKLWAISSKLLRPYRLTARTDPSQGLNQSSILCRVTATRKAHLLSFFLYAVKPQRCCLGNREAGSRTLSPRNFCNQKWVDLVICDTGKICVRSTLLPFRIVLTHLQKMVPDPIHFEKRAKIAL